MRGVSKRDTALLAGQLWTPDALRGSGMIAWYDAADLGTFGATSFSVNPWKNKLTGDLAIQNTGAAQPTFAPIGNNPGRLPEIRDDGGDYMAPNAVIPYGTNGAFTAICVGERTATASNRSFFGQSSNSAPQLLFDTGHTVSLVRNFQLVLVTSSAAASLGYHVVGCQSDLNFSAVTIDGVETSNSTNPGYTQNINLILASQGQVYEGGCCEMIFFSTRLSVADRQRLEGYCAWKWDGGVARDLVGFLPASHPYKNMPPLVGGALRLRRPQVNSAAAAGGFFSRYYYDMSRAA